MLRTLLRSWRGACLLTVLVTVRAEAAELTLTGVVSDAACGLNHHGRDATECTRACAGESGEYALIVGSRVYTLVADDDVRAVLYDLAGKLATVTGDRQTGDVVTVKAVRAESSKRQEATTRQ